MASDLIKGIPGYEDKFNAEEYLKAYTISDTCPPLNAAFFKTFASLFHDVFSAHEPGHRLLDIGSGPTVWHLMSASAKYRYITLSDPLPQNREVQEHYMAEHSTDERFIEHDKLTAELEGNANKWTEVRSRLRLSIDGVIWCDILQDSPLGTNQTVDLYDCVLSSQCLECACYDIETFEKAVRNLSRFAKPGAPVVIAGVLGETYYEFGGNRFAVLTLTPEIIKTSIEEAGCSVTSFKVQHLPPADQTDLNGVFIMEAYKK